MISVFDSLLRPIARLAVARGMLFGQVADRFKLQFVRAAADVAESDKLTDSRISVMTGLQRRDVSRLRKLEDDPPMPLNHLSRLVAVWVGQGGTPLTRKAFDDLALSIRRDVHPRTQLEQLQHAGTISVDDDLVTLVEASYQPLPGSDDQLRYLALNGGDFLTAATSNVLSSPAPFFERAAHFNQLSEEAVSTLEQLFQDKQMALLEDISARAAELQERDPGTDRFRAGTYFYRESSE